MWKVEEKDGNVFLNKRVYRKDRLHYRIVTIGEQI